MNPRRWALGLILAVAALGHAAAQDQSPKPAGVRISAEEPIVQEPSPWGLKGDQLGVDLEAFRTRHRRLAAPGQYAPMCSDANPRGAGVSIEGPVLGRVNCALDYPFERGRRPSEKNFVAPMTVAEIRTVAHVYRFLDGKLWRIEMFIRRDDFAALSAATESKYGKPARVETEQVQNKMGATFTAAILIWEDASQALELREIAGGRVDTSGFILYRKDLEAEAARREKQAAGKAAEDM